LTAIASLLIIINSHEASSTVCLSKKSERLSELAVRACAY